MLMQDSQEIKSQKFNHAVMGLVFHYNKTHIYIFSSCHKKS